MQTVWTFLTIVLTIIAIGMIPGNILIGGPVAIAALASATKAFDSPQDTETFFGVCLAGMLIGFVLKLIGIF